MDLSERVPGELQATFVAREPAPSAGFLALWGFATDGDVVDAAGKLELPSGEAGELATALSGEDGALEAVDVPARLLPVLPAVRALAVLPAAGDWPAWRRPSESVIAYSVAAKLALEIVTAGRAVPILAAGTRADAAIAHWRAVPPADGRLDELAAAAPAAAHALRVDETSLHRADTLLQAFLDAVADTCAREGRRPRERRRPRQRRPFAQMWADALTSDDPVVTDLRVSPDTLVREITAWSEPLLGRDVRAAARLCLRLDPPQAEEDIDTDAGALETAVGPWRLHLLLQAADDPDAVAPASAVWDHAGGRFELGARSVEDPHEALVLGLAQAARLFPPLDAALDERRPTEVTIDTSTAAAFLDEGAEMLSAAGIGVEIPSELEAVGRHRLRPRMRIGAGSSDPGAIDKQASGLFTSSNVSDFRFEIALGDESISREEFAQIASLQQPLVRWRGQWVRVRREDAEDLIDLEGRTGQLDVVEALVAALAGQREIEGIGTVDTVAEGDVAALIRRLRDTDAPEEPDLERFVGELRPYQKRGVAWLQSHAKLGLGAVLADQMGTGKTPQAIALMAAREPSRPHLVVCPTSIVGNWERELNRFAPDVDVVHYHGPERPERLDAFKPGSVAVTSYALMRRDIDFLVNVDWDVVVFDEAQQIKNVSTKGAKAARSLDAQVRVAMTGTPVENRLSELWAIVDLTNPGLLGPLNRFTRQYAVPIERWQDEEAAARLRRLIAPFVMRREKSDPEVSIDLPDKEQVTVACSLTREQAALYQAAVDDAFSSGRLSGSGFGRKGRVLALLTALKQICNHPAQYLGEDEPLAARSGKLARASEILSEVVTSGDRALVFTQYKQMGDLLRRHFADALDLPEVPFLHGSVRRASRDAMVQRFQEDADAPPVFIVSLRAGGVGLNLTRATEVIHYDRWWNPAVEDQAADRAHRIGQTRNVTVHTLVAAGTVEDRIADLLERKRELADAVIGTGEAWITELGEQELRDLVALSMDDVEDDMEEVA